MWGKGIWHTVRYTSVAKRVSNSGNEVSVELDEIVFSHHGESL